MTKKYQMQCAILKPWGLYGKTNKKQVISLPPAFNVHIMWTLHQRNIAFGVRAYVRVFVYLTTAMKYFLSCSNTVLLSLWREEEGRKYIYPLYKFSAYSLSFTHTLRQLCQNPSYVFRAECIQKGVTNPVLSLTHSASLQTHKKA